MPEDLTIQNAAEIRSSILEAVDAATCVEIDLAGVGELDTAGLQVLGLAVREAALRGISLRFVRPSRAVLDVLATVGLDAQLRPMATT